MTIVVDASAIVAALVDGGRDGEWALRLLESDHLAAPHLLPVETANILRRASLAGEIGADVASLAHGDLVQLPIGLFPYEPFADRVWELRENLTAYDAWYVAVAESLGARLATLDARLRSAPGVRCGFVRPPR